MTKKKNSVDDLRSVLFETIAGVRAGTVPLDQARVVADLTQVVVNTAKAEVDFIRATNGKGIASGFLGQQEGQALPAPVPGPEIPPGTLPDAFHGSRRTHTAGDAEPSQG